MENIEPNIKEVLKTCPWCSKLPKVLDNWNVHCKNKLCVLYCRIFTYSDWNNRSHPSAGLVPLDRNRVAHTVVMNIDAKIKDGEVCVELDKVVDAICAKFGTPSNSAVGLDWEKLSLFLFRECHIIDIETSGHMAKAICKRFSKPELPSVEDILEIINRIIPLGLKTYRRSAAQAIHDLLEKGKV